MENYNKYKNKNNIIIQAGHSTSILALKPWEAEQKKNKYTPYELWWL